jgi:hypothetical protein
MEKRQPILWPVPDGTLVKTVESDCHIDEGTELAPKLMAEETSRLPMCDPKTETVT